MASKKPKTYRVQLRPAAERSLRKFDKVNRRRIAQAIDSLATDPYSAQAHKLQGKEGFLRIRVGDYRIIYLVLKKEIRIIVVRIAHRREAYKGL